MENKIISLWLKAPLVYDLYYFMVDIIIVLFGFQELNYSILHEGFNFLSIQNIVFYTYIRKVIS